MMPARVAPAREPTGSCMDRVSWVGDCPFSRGEQWKCGNNEGQSRADATRVECRLAGRMRLAPGIVVLKCGVLRRRLADLEIDVGWNGGRGMQKVIMERKMVAP